MSSTPQRSKLRGMMEGEGTGAGDRAGEICLIDLTGAGLEARAGWHPLVGLFQIEVSDGIGVILAARRMTAQRMRATIDDSGNRWRGRWDVATGSRESFFSPGV